jgi:hypothetical protein
VDKGDEGDVALASRRVGDEKVTSLLLVPFDSDRLCVVEDLPQL